MEVLAGERCVEPQGSANTLHLVAGGARGDKQRCRVSRCKMQQDERQGGYEPQQQECVGYPGRNSGHVVILVAAHRTSTPRWCIAAHAMPCVVYCYWMTRLVSVAEQTLFPPECPVRY